MSASRSDAIPGTASVAGVSAMLPPGRAHWLAEHVLPCESALREWLARRLPLRQDVDDVIQETWAILAGLEAVEHIRQPRSYVYTVAHSVVLQQLRRAQVVSIEAMADPDQVRSDAAACPERNFASRQELDRVAELIAGLPSKCRTAFLLRRVEGYSQREIAQRMQISENTVEKHIGKGIRLLLEAMRAGEGAGQRAGARRAGGGGGHERG